MINKYASLKLIYEIVQYLYSTIKRYVSFQESDMNVLYFMMNKIYIVVKYTEYNPVSPIAL